VDSLWLCTISRISWKRAPVGNLTRSHAGLRSASGNSLSLLGLIPSLIAGVPCGLTNLLPGSGRTVSELESLIGGKPAIVAAACRTEPTRDIQRRASRTHHNNRTPSASAPTI